VKKYTVPIYVAALLLCYLSVSAKEPSPSPERPEKTIHLEPVKLGNETVFNVLDQLEGGFIGDRAQKLSNKLKAIAEDTSIPVDSFDIVDYEKPLTAITVQQTLFAAVLTADARAAGRSRKELAEEWSQKARAAIVKYRNEHSFGWVLRGLLFTLITTVLLVAILYLLNRFFFRWAEAGVTHWMGKRKSSISIQTLKLIQPEQLEHILTGTIRTIRLLLFLALFLFYLQIVLRFFPWTRPYAGQVDDYVLAVLGTVGEAVLSQVPNLVFLSVISLITVYVLKLMHLIFTGIENRTIRPRKFQPEWAQPTYRLCRIGVVAFALVVAFPYIPGSDSLAFKGVSIFLGVLFSLGSTSAIANIIAGYMIIYRNLFKEGDRVKIEDFMGTVIKTGLQVIHLRTVKNEEIMVPSSMIVNSHVINYSALARKHGLILYTAVTIGYDVPWRQVHSLLLMAAEKTPGLLREPKPFVLQKSLDDFYVSYELNAHTDDPQKMEKTYSELHKNIQDAFNEYGVQIMSPSYRDDPAKPKVVPKEQWYAPPARKPDEETG
jgi:small-conductance mechanosensitive channel